MFHFKGPPFKPSSKKGEKEIEFAPMNLHLHRTMVSIDDNNAGMIIDDILTIEAYLHHHTASNNCLSVLRVADAVSKPVLIIGSV